MENSLSMNIINNTKLFFTILIFFFIWITVSFAQQQTSKYYMEFAMGKDTFRLKEHTNVGIELQPEYYRTDNKESGGKLLKITSDSLFIETPIGGFKKEVFGYNLNDFTMIAFEPPARKAAKIGLALLNGGIGGLYTSPSMAKKFYLNNKTWTAKIKESIKD